jgi:DNA-binding NarL/FixJ family response regulator
VHINDDAAHALVVTGDHVRDDYVSLLSRLGLAANAFARTDDAAASLDGTAPAVAILEVEDNGCSMLRQLRDRYGPDIPVVLVSADRTSPADVVAGLLIGADDYAAESMDAEEFIARVRRLIDRTRRTPAATVDLTRLSTLTKREREVLGLVAEGKSQKQIATVLGISVKTVGAHVQNVLSKLGLHSRVEAVAMVVRAGAATAISAAGPMGSAIASSPFVG